MVALANLALVFVAGLFTALATGVGALPSVRSVTVRLRNTDSGFGLSAWGGVAPSP